MIFSVFDIFEMLIDTDLFGKDMSGASMIDADFFRARLCLGDRSGIGDFYQT